MDGAGGISAEALRIYNAFVGAPQPAMDAGIAALRDHYQRFNDDRQAEMEAQYRTEIRESAIGGVPVHIVTPEGADGKRVLINLHGGGFMWGAGSGALVEAIPIAAVSGITVVTVDYRMAPEHLFPAGSDDAVAVYRTLLADQAPEAIGIYGCSAGGVLAAQTIAALRRQEVPMPAAIATLYGTGLDMVPDPALERTAENANVPSSLSATPYLAGTSSGDPAVFPGASLDELRHFPPTLLITAGHDFAAGSVTTMHRRMVAAGVEAQLFVFDRLWHAFHVFPTMPESQEVYTIVSDFFAKRLRG